MLDAIKPLRFANPFFRGCALLIGADRKVRCRTHEGPHEDCLLGVFHRHPCAACHSEAHISDGYLHRVPILCEGCCAMYSAMGQLAGWERVGFWVTSPPREVVRRDFEQLWERLVATDLADAVTTHGDVVVVPFDDWRHAVIPTPMARARRIREIVVPTGLAEEAPPLPEEWALKAALVARVAREVLDAEREAQKAARRVRERRRDLLGS